MESFSSFHKQHTEDSFLSLSRCKPRRDDYRQANLRQTPQACTRMRCHIRHKTSSKSLFLRPADISDYKSLQAQDKFYWKWHSVLSMESLGREANSNRVPWAVFCSKPQCILQTTSSDGEGKLNIGHSSMTRQLLTGNNLHQTFLHGWMAKISAGWCTIALPQAETSPSKLKDEPHSPQAPSITLVYIPTTDIQWIRTVSVYLQKKNQFPTRAKTA